MKTTQHTPGPWRIAPDMHGICNSPVAGVIDATGCAIANCGSSGNANARLIAAAPDLLQFARDFLAMWTAAGPTDSPMEAQARAAIAKATGGDHV